MSVSSKQVHKYADIKDKILEAVDIISDPIRGTISPKGRNVLFQDEQGRYLSTNDGATIAKHISVSDPIQEAIIQIIKGGSLKTNTEAGDGTSTTILLSRVLIKEGFKLIDNGWNNMELKREFERFGTSLIAKLKTHKMVADTDMRLRQVANVSANNDAKVADDILKVVKIAKLDGMVFLEPNTKDETEIVADSGFYINAGLFHPDLRNDPNRFTATYSNVPVLVTDKRIYYPEEAETILKTVLMAGHKAVVIVARDFVGQSVNTFMANHSQGVCKILLVKDPKVTEKDNTSLSDLATYLDVKLTTEKTGSLVDKLTIKDFVIADKVYADNMKTIIGSKKKVNIGVSQLITAIRAELEKKKDDPEMKSRLASLTNGVVTLKIGGPTTIEMVERIYRYEDALNATRAAMRDGYLVGGGVAIFRVFQENLLIPIELAHAYKEFCSANIKQIAENCGKHPDTILSIIKISKPNFGFNAVNGKVEDLLKAGVIDPYKVTEMAIINSISIAGQIISSNYLIVNEEEDISTD